MTTRRPARTSTSLRRFAGGLGVVVLGTCATATTAGGAPAAESRILLMGGTAAGVHRSPACVDGPALRRRSQRHRTADRLTRPGIPGTLRDQPVGDCQTGQLNR
ncbi:hypothetical protein [Nocardia beijingensis]|uniref:hypothetical protein n=1 Tax=Nocardia beijingensis TaxID=95162 RepID=UPI003408D429